VEEKGKFVSPLLCWERIEDLIDFSHIPWMEGIGRVMVRGKYRLGGEGSKFPKRLQLVGSSTLPHTGEISPIILSIEEERTKMGLPLPSKEPALYYLDWEVDKEWFTSRWKDIVGNVPTVSDYLALRLGVGIGSIGGMVNDGEERPISSGDKFGGITSEGDIYKFVLSQSPHPLILIDGYKGKTKVKVDRGLKIISTPTTQGSKDLTPSQPSSSYWGYYPQIWEEKGIERVAREIETCSHRTTLRRLEDNDELDSPKKYLLREMGDIKESLLYCWPDIVGSLKGEVVGKYPSYWGTALPHNEGVDVVKVPHFAVRDAAATLYTSPAIPGVIVEVKVKGWENLGVGISPRLAAALTRDFDGDVVGVGYNLPKSPLMRWASEVLPILERVAGATSQIVENERERVAPYKGSKESLMREALLRAKLVGIGHHLSHKRFEKTSDFEKALYAFRLLQHQAIQEKGLVEKPVAPVMEKIFRDKVVGMEVVDYSYFDHLAADSTYKLHSRDKNIYTMTASRFNNLDLSSYTSLLERWNKMRKALGGSPLTSKDLLSNKVTWERVNRSIKADFSGLSQWEKETAYFKEIVKSGEVTSYMRYVVYRITHQNRGRDLSLVLLYLQSNPQWWEKWRNEK